MKRLASALTAEEKPRTEGRIEKQEDRHTKTPFKGAKNDLKCADVLKKRMKTWRRKKNSRTNYVDNRKLPL